VNDTSLRLTRGQGGRGAGTRAQLRRVGRRIWDDARKEEFLAVLARHLQCGGGLPRRLHEPTRAL
jgi:hypothetical protein